jgi:MerR family transcriptional regulator, redox-sensitive transcriptional activator SoxR
LTAELLTIGELARRAGRRASSIRYYEAVGLLPEPLRVSGRRRYPEESLRTLAVIETAQRSGLSLADIRALLGAAPGNPAAIEELRRIAVRKLPELDVAIERAVVVRKWLEAASRCECPGLDDCPLFVGDATPACDDVKAIRGAAAPLRARAGSA